MTTPARGKTSKTHLGFGRGEIIPAKHPTSIKMANQAALYLYFDTDTDTDTNTDTDSGTNTNTDTGTVLILILIRKLRY